MAKWVNKIKRKLFQSSFNPMNQISNKYFKVVQKTTVILTISNIFSNAENRDLIFVNVNFNPFSLEKNLIIPVIYPKKETIEVQRSSIILKPTFECYLFDL